MEKSRQRGIIDYFSLKGLIARKTQKELTDTLSSDACSQVQISRWLARFGTGDISCLDEGGPGRPVSILGSTPEHFLEKHSFASAPIIAMHFNVSHSTVKDIFSRELGLRKFSRRRYHISDPTLRKSFALKLQSTYLCCRINIRVAIQRNCNR
jgi:hypothetical protein